ncbi:phosphopantetheine-binding protein [Micromonospora sp. NPDC049051]|uniref:phosphopantetheine-binding protein n=1 Tax=Micromonospora sp. NPDC049051 TaxID=3364264 RepID=UPI00371EF45D
MNRHELEEEVVRLVVEASEHPIGRDTIASLAGDLAAVGYTSLSYLRLLSAIESELDVYISPADLAREPLTIARLVGRVAHEKAL